MSPWVFSTLGNNELEFDMQLELCWINVSQNLQQCWRIQEIHGSVVACVAKFHKQIACPRSRDFGVAFHEGSIQLVISNSVPGCQRHTATQPHGKQPRQQLIYGQRRNAELLYTLHLFSAIAFSRRGQKHVTCTHP